MTPTRRAHEGSLILLLLQASHWSGRQEENHATIPEYPTTGIPTVPTETQTHIHTIEMPFIKHHPGKAAREEKFLTFWIYIKRKKEVFKPRL